VKATRLAAPASLIQRLTGLLLIGLFALPQWSLAAEPATVKLDMTPLPNSSQQHDVSLRTSINMQRVPSSEATAQNQQDPAMPGMTMNMQMRQRVDAGAPAADGSIPVKASATTLKAEMQTAQGQVQPLPMPNPSFNFTATLRDGRYENIDMSGGAAGNLPAAVREKMFKQIFDGLSKFNGQSVRVGESIELPMQVDMPMAGAGAGNMNVLAKYTLRSIQKGVASFDIALRMDVDVDMPPAASPASAPEAAASAPAQAMPAAKGHMKMSGGGTGQLDYRIADRLQLSSTINMTMQMNMNTPDGMTLKMDMSMAMSSKGSRPSSAAPKAAKAPAKAS
jgi:hypothetical protein